MTFLTFYSFGLENHARDIHNVQTRRDFKRSYTRTSYTPRPQIRKQLQRRTKNKSINLVTDTESSDDDDIQIVSPKKSTKKSTSRRKKASSASTVRFFREIVVDKNITFFFFFQG